MTGIDCINIRGLRLPWKRGYLLNNLMSLCVDVATIGESKLSDLRYLITFFGGYETFLFLFRPGKGGGTLKLFRKDLGLKIKAVFLDLEGNLVDLGVNSSDGGAAYSPTGGAELSNYFKRLEVFLGTSLNLVFVGD